MSDIAIIGGTGLGSLAALEVIRREVVHTPFGAPSSPLSHGRMFGVEVTFLARHGYGHTIAPHRVNYRANLWALHSAGVRRVIAVASVGGIRDDLEPGTVAVPDQVIDYTWGRSTTFQHSDCGEVQHIDFTEPYDRTLRQALVAAAAEVGVTTRAGGTYAAVSGPRLETAAEIDRLERDGADMVGMTSMPEAALAREIGLAYACLAVVSNRAAGRGTTTVHEQIDTHLRAALSRALEVIGALLPRID